MSSQQPYQNMPSGTPPPPPPSTGYTNYSDQGAQGYVQPGSEYVPPARYPQSGPGYAPPAGYPQSGPGYAPPAGYGQPAYPGVGYVQRPPDSRRGIAITGFILGIISLFLWILFSGVGALANIIVFILGIIFSSLGMRSTSLRGLAIAGLVLSILGGLITVIIFIIGIIALYYARSHGY